MTSSGASNISSLLFLSLNLTTTADALKRCASLSLFPRTTRLSLLFPHLIMLWFPHRPFLQALLPHHRRLTQSASPPRERLGRSGLQREVLSLYRACLRAVRQKPEVGPVSLPLSLSLFPTHLLPIPPHRQLGKSSSSLPVHNLDNTRKLGQGTWQPQSICYAWANGSMKPTLPPM